jgi:predicted nucleotidyltransferase
MQFEKRKTARSLSLPAHIGSLVCDLKRKGHSVWLLGSRANGTSTPGSDWDLLVFGDLELAKELAQISPVDLVDLLVVIDRDRFLSPWNKTIEGLVKSGSLSSWEWSQVDSQSATYSGTKWPNDWGSTKNAIKL